ncbi:MAG: radical SAM protein, partial [Nanoarchaeota archaeon]|nr:radical SAM protein [Nanoarchaeota archaeon]
LLEDINRYFPEKKHNVLPISTTRGCAFRCGFCHNSNKNVKCYLGKYRIASPKRAIEEFKFVQSLVKNKIDYLDVGEDLHLISMDYAVKFCEAIKNSGIKDLKWNTSTRYDILTKEMINLIAKCNCKRVLVGVESGSRRIQELNGKLAELEKARSLAKYMRHKGIFVTNAYIFGHPTETAQELNQTIKFIKEIPADENLIQLYRPMPATPYFELCVKEGKIDKIPKKLEEWGGFGVLGKDVNVSRVTDKILFSCFYKINLIEQTKYLFNQQRYYLREGIYSKFIKSFYDNRFTHKLKEYMNI